MLGPSTLQWCFPNGVKTPIPRAGPLPDCAECTVKHPRRPADRHRWRRKRDLRPPMERECFFRLHAWQLTYTGTGADGLTLTKTKTPPCSTRRPPTTLDHGTGVASGPGFHIRWPRTDTWPFRRVSCGMKDPHRPEAYVGRIKFKLTRPGRRCRDGRRMRGLGK